MNELKVHRASLLAFVIQEIYQIKVQILSRTKVDNELRHFRDLARGPVGTIRAINDVNHLLRDYLA